MRHYNLIETHCEIEGDILFEFEDIVEDEVFYDSEIPITWKELREKMKRKLLEQKILTKLKKLGIQRIEVGSIAWFSGRRKTKGLFIALNTMFLARLLKK